VLLFFNVFPCFSQEGYERLINQADQLADSMKVENLLEYSARIYKSDTGKANEYLEQAYAVARSIHSKNGIAKYWDQKGYYARNAALYLQAIEYHNRAKKIAIQIGDSILLSKIFNNLGVVYRRTDQYGKATEYHLKALQISNKLDIERSRTIAINSLGNIELARGDFKKGIEYFAESLESERKNNNKRGEAINLNNIGEAYEGLGKLDTALLFYVQSLEVNKELGSKKGLTISYNCIGNVYKRKKEYQRALSYYKQAFNVAKGINDRYYLAFLNVSTGEVYMHLNDFQSAYFYLINGIKIAKEINSKMSLRDAYFNLSELYEKQNLNHNALNHYKIGVAYRDSIMFAENQENISRLQGIIENEKNQKELELLRNKEIIREKDFSKQRFLLILMVISFFAAVALGLIYYRMYYYKSLSNKKLKIQKKEIEEQRNSIEIKNKILEEANMLVESYMLKLTDSIEYAQKIQNAMLPPLTLVKSYFPESFIFYKPKDIVSGDFYWFGEVGDKVMFSVADCTGHGVPGAFMSLIGYELINQAVHVNNLLNPALVLDFLNDEIKVALRKSDLNNELKDGIDIAFCSFDRESGLLEYAGALNPLAIVRNHEIILLKANRMTIGANNVPTHKAFDNQRVLLQKGDVMYLFTDGYVSQFGGPDNKKFNKRKFKDLLLSIQDLSMIDQKITINEILKNWMGKREQIDDILIMGLKYQ